jgi:hypothetical protein
MVVLSAIFTTARNDQVTSLHPCQGEDPACPGSAAHHHPGQFAVMYECLPGLTAQSCQPVTPGSAASPP